jgi:hypothetical protein
MATPTALPASFTSGQVLTAADTNLLRGAFRILQVVSTATAIANVGSSTITQVDTGLTATITPQYTTSKILVFTNQVFDKTAGNADNAVRTQLMRKIGAADTQLTNIALALGLTQTLIYGEFTASSTYLDSPATTSACVYRTTFSNITNNAQVIANVGTNPSMTLMEISA